MYFFVQVKWKMKIFGFLFEETPGVEKNEPIFFLIFKNCIKNAINQISYSSHCLKEKNCWI